MVHLLITHYNVQGPRFKSLDPNKERNFTSAEVVLPVSPPFCPSTLNLSPIK